MRELDFDGSMRWLDELYHRPFLPARVVELRRIGRLMHELGDPHRAFRSVHIAGSSGKGSTTTMIGEILRAEGYRTGVFRSPHLQSPTERIEVDGEDISRADWVRCFNRVLPVAEQMESGALPGYDLGRPTFFEVFFAVMALHFKERHVEWAAVETGLGGRLDATNLLTSDVAVITNISLEHTKLLGSTVEAIAREKAAIIKPGCSAVTAADHRDALRVIRARAAEVRAPLHVLADEVEVSASNRSLDGQDLCLERGLETVKVRIPLAGSFQAVNAATAYLAVVALRERGVSVSDTAVRRGLSAARPPGRMQLISRSPLIMLDGAHNPAAAGELGIALRDLLPSGKAVLVFAAMADKNIPAMAAALAPAALRVVATRAPGTERAADPEIPAAAFRQYLDDVRVIDDADQALTESLAGLAPDEALVVCGSLYLVGHASSILDRVGSHS